MSIEVCVLIVANEYTVYTGMTGVSGIAGFKFDFTSQACAVYLSNGRPVLSVRLAMSELAWVYLPTRSWACIVAWLIL